MLGNTQSTSSATIVPDYYKADVWWPDLFHRFAEYFHLWQMTPCKSDIYIFKLYFFILSWPGSHIYCWVCRKLQMYTHLSTKRGSFLAFLIGPHINIQYILGWRLEEQHQYNRCVTATSPDYFHILLFIAPLWCSAPLSTDMECKGNGITTL